MEKIKICILNEQISESINKFKEIVEKIDWSDSFETLKNIDVFREVEDEEEFKPVYRKRHWKRAKGAVGIWKR